ncbi:hypothetical protein SDC9_161757 [bioreactor metagenome]|uniref:Uncharacterized protein n=1 Tax=bioreactor metagenome TaxID=1076179 RepID=A0A645FKE0_9ZZZZ
MGAVRQNIKAAFIPDKLVARETAVAFLGDKADDEGADRGDAQAEGRERFNQVGKRIPDPEAFDHFTLSVEGETDSAIQ